MLDAYSHLRNSADRHNIYSCSKSVTSALIGIAIDKGYIKSEHQPVLGFFPEYTAQNLDDDKKAVTLEHVLTMTVGANKDDNLIGVSMVGSLNMPTEYLAEMVKSFKFKN